MRCAACSSQHGPYQGLLHKTWVADGCVSFRSDTLQNHHKSKTHSAAYAKWRAGGGQAEHESLVDVAVQPSVARKRWIELSRQQSVAMLTLFKIIYTLCKRRIALNNVDAIRELVASTGAKELLTLRGNAAYTSWDFLTEAVEVMSDQIERAMLADARAGVFSLMADESTDIAVTKQLVICIRYPHSNKSVTKFLTIRELTDGTANTIVDEIKRVLVEKQLQGRRMRAFASDGASVFTGAKNGVHKQLGNSFGPLIAVHCQQHQSVLALVWAVEQVPWLHHNFQVCPSRVVAAF
jgi:hypothetical protein